jgi:hypothetical protein
MEEWRPDWIAFISLTPLRHAEKTRLVQTNQQRLRIGQVKRLPPPPSVLPSQRVLPNVRFLGKTLAPPIWLDAKALRLVI